MLATFSEARQTHSHPGLAGDKISTPANPHPHHIGGGCANPHYSWDGEGSVTLINSMMAVDVSGLAMDESGKAVNRLFSPDLKTVKKYAGPSQGEMGYGAKAPNIRPLMNFEKAAAAAKKTVLVIKRKEVL
ncbi:MAG: hypothetical protein JW943_07415 [Deltaproteobacteria bacterium]|nr:hypothetical protein [Deltaproteobacteria bacterium]